MLLHKFDLLIRDKVTPIHYGRYVDDMFLVMKDNGSISSANDLMLFLQQRLGKHHFNNSGMKKESKIWRINLGLPFQKQSSIELQSDKQKLFILNGQGGIDLLDSIEKEISKLSSEHRLMPSPDQLEHTTAARVLSAADSTSEPADTLRRADGLSIRRLSWALQLRHVETLARDLHPYTWNSEREDFYQFSYNHILRPDAIFSHFTYLPRLLSFAIGMNDWNQAGQIVKRAYKALKQLSDEIKSKETSGIIINGCKFYNSDAVWIETTESISLYFIDAVLKSYSLVDNHKLDGRASRLINVILGKMRSINGITSLNLTADDICRKSPLLLISDLAKKPYKDSDATNINPDIFNKRVNSNDYILNKLSDVKFIDKDTLECFLNKTLSNRIKCSPENYIPYIFPTRPYTPSEIAELAPECVGLGDIDNYSAVLMWAKYTKVLRGTWVKPYLLDNKHSSTHNVADNNRPKVNIGCKKRKSVTLAITNFFISDESWASSASGKPNLSLDRYKSIAEMVNYAVKMKPKPDYLIFPELSIPIEWMSSVANRLTNAGISLIAGAEYRHFINNEIISEACLQLTDNRLGFPSSVRVWQKKNQPAVGEDKELIWKHGKSWKKTYNNRPIYIHNDFHFGVMVCSEVQNSKERVAFQGEIDALMVLAWNQDLETFSSLIESAALDIHTYSVLVNNRKYGDSRVRAPSKELFRRDLARLRGGENDYCVTVTLDIEAIRSFQSREKRWPDSKDPFKPVPEGFIISDSRRILPAK